MVHGGSSSSSCSPVNYPYYESFRYLWLYPVVRPCPSLKCRHFYNFPLPLASSRRRVNVIILIGPRPVVCPSVDCFHL